MGIKLYMTYGRECATSTAAYPRSGEQQRPLFASVFNVALIVSLLAFLAGCVSPEMQRLADTEPAMVVNLRGFIYELRTEEPQDGTLDILADLTTDNFAILSRSERVLQATEAATLLATERCREPRVIYAGRIDTRLIFISHIIRFTCD